MDREGNGISRYRMVIITAALALLIVLILFIMGVFGGGARRLSVTKLRCIATQQVTPFGDKVLYYDGTTLCCLTANGTEQWKYALGPGARFGQRGHRDRLGGRAPAHSQPRRACHL